MYIICCILQGNSKVVEEVILHLQSQYQFQFQYRSLLQSHLQSLYQFQFLYRFLWQYLLIHHLLLAILQIVHYNYKVLDTCIILRNFIQFPMGKDMVLDKCIGILEEIRNCLLQSILFRYHFQFLLLVLLIRWLVLYQFLCPSLSPNFQDLLRFLDQFQFLNQKPVHFKQPLHLNLILTLGQNFVDFFLYLQVTRILL